MNPEEIRAAIEAFIHLIEKGEGNEQANFHALLLCLDQLALAYHYAEADLDSEKDAPSRDYGDIRRLATSRFPQLGFYYELSRTANAEEPGQVLGGDALDDVADIARDLYEVLWYWDNHFEGTALWQFRWGYENHWGEHLRSLQNYLYTLQYWD